MADDARRKRLRYRAWHRGTKESDFILGSFADAKLPTMDAAGLDAFEALLDVPDPVIYDWVTRRAPVPATHLAGSRGWRSGPDSGKLRPPRFT